MPEKHQEFSEAERIRDDIGHLRLELRGIRLFLTTLATKIGLRCTQRKIMSAVSEYVQAVEAAHTEISTGVDEMVTAIGGISQDVTALKDLITKLENNPGPISPEDQALLTNALNVATGLANRVKDAATALKELDAATETPPPAPPA